MYKNNPPRKLYHKHILNINSGFYEKLLKHEKKTKKWFSLTKYLILKLN